MNLIDFHAHILPQMDDGAKNLEEAVQMLRASHGQCVRKIVATPHFYPDMESPEAFLQRRMGAAKALYKALGETNAPAVYLGAEVAYFPGISRYAQIRDLCIAGSRCILIEMPFDEWTTTVTDEIIALHECAGLLPVLAHIERYTYHERVLKNLLAHHVLIQSNSAFFYSFRTKRRALRMLKREEIHLLGSDCHNMHTRIPDLARCAEVIQKRCGEAFLQSCAAFGETLLKDAVPLDVLMKKEFLEPGSVSLDA